LLEQSPGCDRAEGVSQRLSKWRPALEPGPVYLGFMVNSVAPRDISLRFLPVRVILPLNHTHLLLSTGLNRTVK